MPLVLPAETMPRQLAQTAPTMANFDYIVAPFRTGTAGWVATFDPTQPMNFKWAPGGGTGTVTSITATPPIQVTPNPITNTGDIEHMASGVTAGTYGDATHWPVVTFDADGHATSASQQAAPSGGGTGFFWALVLGA